MTEEHERSVSWRELLIETESVLAATGHVSRPDLEARWIIEDLLDADRPDIERALDQPARVRGVSRLDAMVARRRSGEPIQYVLGHWAFRSLDLMVDPRVLIPRPETEVVASAAIAELDRSTGDSRGVVVDLGTGSGAIGLSIAAERPGTEVILTDASAEALAVARANLAGLGTVGTGVEICLGSWFDAVPDRLRGECDVVVSNPPYVASTAVLAEEVERWEPTLALRAGPEGLDDIDVILGSARQWVRPGGAVVLEIDPAQADHTIEKARVSGFDPEVLRDLAGRHRVVVARVPA